MKSTHSYDENSQINKIEMNENNIWHAIKSQLFTSFFTHEIFWTVVQRKIGDLYIFKRLFVVFFFGKQWYLLSSLLVSCFLNFYRTRKHCFYDLIRCCFFPFVVSRCRHRHRCVCTQISTQTAIVFVYRNMNQRK